MAQGNDRSSAAGLEFKAVTVLALGFGLVGIDRFMISVMFPVIAKDLALDYGDIGTITGALAIAWGIAALFMGNLADRIGRHKVLVASLLLFSALIGLSGLATGLASLVLVRVIMGFADGAYTPASISATLDVSPPQRSGRNIGFQQMTGLLFGLGFAPLLIPTLLHIIDWRWVFAIFALPGFVLAWLTYRIIPRGNPTAHPTEPRAQMADWREVLSYPNIRFGMLLMLCWLTCLVTVSAFLPNYMIDYLGLEFAQMGAVMSAIGFGGAIGTIILPWLSDRLGRKTVMIAGAALVFIALLALARCGPDVPSLFASLFFVMFGIMALITLTVGPLCAETVPPHLMATASGVVIATGELFGGGLAPIIAGYAATELGIQHILILPTAAILLALLLCMRLQKFSARTTENEAVLTT